MWEHYWNPGFGCGITPMIQGTWQARICPGKEPKMLKSLQTKQYKNFLKEEIVFWLKKSQIGHPVSNKWRLVKKKDGTETNGYKWL